MNLPVKVKPRIYVKNVALFIACVVILLPMSWVMYSSSPDVTDVSRPEDKLISLQERLDHVISEQHFRKNDVNALRRQVGLLLNDHISFANRSRVGNSSASNQHPAAAERASGQDLRPPGMLNYLPHLVGKPQALKAAFKMSRGRSAVSIVMGVPTVMRPKEDYLIATVRSLIDNLSESDKNDALIIVFIAEFDNLEYVKSVAQKLNQTFPKDIDSGLLEVISPPAEFYDLTQLKVTFGDPIERVRWRTKQNLDYSFLMLYAQSKGIYYVQLEDDIITKPDYHKLMLTFALSQKTDNWMLLEYSHLGFIGKLFRTRDLPLITEFILMFHRDKPIDWLLDHFFTVRLCSPEKTQKHCQRAVAEIRRRYVPSLFQHVGRHSSLKGKVQKLKDRDFNRKKKNEIPNPPADVTTTLSCYQHFSIERAYAGEVFFWATLPHANDQVLFKFLPPIKIKNFLFRSGHPEHPGDKFYNTSVQVLPQSTAESRAKAELNNDKNTPDDFVTIGQFDPTSGVAEGKVDAKFGVINSLRLLIHTSSQSWVILQTITIEVDKS